jgi:antitoxin CptB
MSGLSRTSEDLDPRRRRILYHAWHRGTRELDLLLGRYADSAVGELSDAELDEFEALMEEDDRALFSWLLGKAEIPERYADGLVERISAFSAAHPLTD